MRKRPDPSSGKTYKLDSGLKKYYITINSIKHAQLEDDPTCGSLSPIPIEVFVASGKAGTETRNCYDTIARLISLLMKEEVDIKKIIKCLKGVEGDVIFWQGKKFKSPLDAIANLLEIEFLNKNATIEKHLINAKEISKIEKKVSWSSPPEYEKAEEHENKSDSNYTEKYEVKISDILCPDCNSELIHIEGCEVCSNQCGYSRC